MDYPKISVVIPAFQAERTLNRAVASVIEQSYPSREIIIINDGSLDKTGAIADSIAEECSLVRVIHQRNRGRSAARNAGIKEARGEWLFFLDSDDHLLPNALKNLAKAFLEAQNSEPDGHTRCLGVWGGYKTSSGDVETFEHPHAFSAIELYRKLLGDLQLHQLREEGTLLRSASGKLYIRKDIIEKSIKFREGLRFGEDALFNLVYLQLGGFVKLIREPIFYYDKSMSNTTNRFDADDGKYLLGFSREATRIVSECTASEVQSVGIDAKRLIGVEALTTLRRAALSDVTSKELGILLSEAYRDPTILAGIKSVKPSHTIKKIIHKIRLRLLNMGKVDGAIRFERAVLSLKKDIERVQSGADR